MHPNINDVVNGTISPIAFMFTIGGTWKILILVATAFFSLFFLLLVLFEKFLKAVIGVRVESDSDKNKRCYLHTSAWAGLAFIVELLLPTIVYQNAVDFIEVQSPQWILLFFMGLIVLPGIVRNAVNWIKSKKSGTSSDEEEKKREE